MRTEIYRLWECCKCTKRIAGKRSEILRSHWSIFWDGENDVIICPECSDYTDDDSNVMRPQRMEVGPL